MLAHGPWTAVPAGSPGFCPSSPSVNFLRRFQLETRGQGTDSFFPCIDLHLVCCRLLCTRYCCTVCTTVVLPPGNYVGPRSASAKVDYYSNALFYTWIQREFGHDPVGTSLPMLRGAVVQDINTVFHCMAYIVAPAAVAVLLI